METTETPLLVAVEDGVALLTLNRPKVLNALNATLLDALEAALDRVDADPAVRALILTGAGDRAFAAGADIAELNALAGSAAGEAQGRRGQRLTRRLESLRVPTIAAVNGFALGGGCELAMACDIRIASETASFGQPEVNLGIPPGYGGTQRLARLTSRGYAMLLCLSAERIDAAEALRAGLVERVVPAAELLGAARSLAATIASKGPVAVELTKRAIARGTQMTLEDGLAYEAALFGVAMGTEDFREGTAAFLGKRAAAFKGR